jgi:hypothetical protein
MESRVLSCILILVLAFVALKSTAQNEYLGARVALFEVEIMQQKKQGLTLRCRMANTGRQTLGTKNTSAEMMVEFDALGLPALLRGHESAIEEAVRNNCPKLKPGELSDPIWLDVRLKPRAMGQLDGCAEMEFDTAFVEEWGERTMRIRFFLKNTGNAAAHFFSKKAEPLVKVYFVGGTKLTRGAIPAGNTSIRKGSETLDGVLLPGQVLEGTVEIGLQDRSKFSPNIALEFDPAQAVDECGRVGNVWVIKLRF